VSPVLTFVILTFVVHRVSRFIWMDDLIEDQRDWLKGKLLGLPNHPNVTPEEIDAWVSMSASKRSWRASLRYKLFQLIDCVWCISIWVSAATVLAHRIFVEPVPAPVWWWLGLSGAAVAIAEWTDGEKTVKIKKDQ
jgi:hypothetical protein